MDGVRTIRSLFNGVRRDSHHRGRGCSSRGSVTGVYGIVVMKLLNRQGKT